ncbi:hypothetical protein GCM10007923_47920 [Shinella yambaruensis]|uniref:Uncharacterized protein n=1 Tax=Shinella yambaruensis TaxID=415996 RepID=A0ABQ5ZRD2_9HYPH|nr:hypothetical protein GCM10007923_47920 [Shinella yambaruensis]
MAEALPETFHQEADDDVTTHPSRKPPVGPMQAPKPPRPPERSGRPIATRIRKRIIDRPPRLAPRTPPARMAPRDCAVIGTPTTGRVMGGKTARAAVMAAKVAMKTVSRVSMWFGGQDAYHPGPPRSSGPCVWRRGALPLPRDCYFPSSVATKDVLKTPETNCSF